MSDPPWWLSQHAQPGYGAAVTKARALPHCTGPCLPRVPAQGCGKVRAGSHPHLLMPPCGPHRTLDAPPLPHARAVCTPFTGGETGSGFLKGAHSTQLAGVPQAAAGAPRRLHPPCLHLLGPLSALLFPEREKSGPNGSWMAPAFRVPTSPSQLPGSLHLQLCLRFLSP